VEDLDVVAEQGQRAQPQRVHPQRTAHLAAGLQLGDGPAQRQVRDVVALVAAFAQLVEVVRGQLVRDLLLDDGDSPGCERGRRPQPGRDGVGEPAGEQLERGQRLVRRAVRVERVEVAERAL
jgi:hypothetical protein